MTKIDLMNKYNFNEAQAEVILDNSKELIVPAGAGSGKTKTLVGKIIHLLKKGYDLESFLVLTFTKKAAGEMKQRIKQELILEGLDHLINKIDSSNIQTFDGFAYNFVKQNASLAGLDSNLELLDPAILNYIKTSLARDLVKEIIKDPNNKYYHLIETYSDSNNYDTFLSDLINLYEKLIAEKPLKDYHYKELINRNLINVDIVQLVSEISEDFYKENEYKINMLANYLKNLLNNNSIEFLKLENYKWGELEEKSRRRIKKIVDPVDSLYKKRVTSDDYNNIINQQLNDSKLLLELLIVYETKLTEFKVESNKYEFNDIANFLNKILKENKTVLKRIKDNIRFVFVDEYQDTSLVQSEFLEMLIANNNDINVLYVGDLKQSIYKFRDAKPETFIEKLKTSSVISLGINYRSSSKIIDFVNNIFTNILTDEEIYDINYKKGHYMHSGSTAFTSDQHADVYLIEAYSENNKASTSEEAFIIGNKIKELMANNVTNKYSDFAILMRNKSSFKIFKDVFEYLNIPLQVQTPFDVKQAYLLKLIANILSLSLNLNKDNFDRFKFDYFSILRSELFAISDFELFSEFVNEKFDKIDYDNEFYKKLKRIESAIYTKSNYEIINQVIMEFEIYEKIIKAPKSFEKSLQIDYLLNISKPLTDIGIYGVDFVNYVEEIAYNEKLKLSVDILDNKEENSVVLTNIHQSKGLEYPILFLAELTKKFQATRSNQFTYTKDAGLVYKNTGDESTQYLSSLQRDLSKNLELKESLKEEMRLLYTAITRAERALYIVGLNHDSHDELASFNDYLYHFGMKDFIASNNIETLTESLENKEYSFKLKDQNKYYPSIIDLKNHKKLADLTILKEETIASVKINNLIDEKTKVNLEKGTKLHEELEYGPLFKKLLKHNFNNKDLKTGKVIKELPFYYEDKNRIFEGIIDLVVVYNDEIHIIDYKTYDIDINKYENQLNSYYNYLKLIYPKMKIRKYMYSIVKDLLKEV